MKIFVFQVEKENENERKSSIGLFAKIFFFVLCVWINEIITSAIATTYGTDETCYYRFVLDVPNTFMGVILFIMMIFSKRQVRNKVLESIGLSMFTSETQSRTESIRMSEMRS